MAFCKQCGKEISDNLTVCEECSNANNVNKNTQSTNETFVNDAVNSTMKAVNGILDTKDTTKAYSAEEIEKNKIICALAYISILFWLPLVAGTKDSKYCKFHANQGLLLLILGVVFFAVGLVLGLIPIVGVIIGILTSLIELGYFLFGLIYTLTGKSKELPFIGGIKIIQ